MAKKPGQEPYPAKKKRYTGRFAQCAATYFAHANVVAFEVCQGKSGAYFGDCPCCMARTFLKTWEEGWGYTLAEIESRGGTAPAVPPARREELLRR